MLDKTTKSKSTIIGLIALLPLLTLILFIADFIECETIIKTILIILIAASTSYGWVMLARPLAEESVRTGRLL